MKRALILLALWLGTSAAQADTRVALVIGNGTYRHVDPLINPRLDARAMKAALERIGFAVVYGEDLDQKQLGQKIAEFADAAQGADVALTYYAGHGSTFEGTSYLVPVDAEFKSLKSVTYELVPLEKMLGELRQAKGIRIAIIDACRDNAKERELKRVVAERGGTDSRGLARVQNAAGLILAFSTQYNQTAADGPPNTNSPFTAALLRQLPTPGLDVREMFFKVGYDVELSTNSRQQPAIEVSLFKPYALVPAAPTGVITSVTPAPAPAQPAAQMATLPPVMPVPVVAPAPTLNPHRQKLIAACDRLAGRYGDPDLPAGTSGVTFSAIDADAAIPACRAAVEAAQIRTVNLSTTGVDPAAVEERRMRFQLGRALSADKQYKEAFTQYEQASNLGSATAMTGLGYLFHYGQGMAQDYAAARRWYENAADKGDPLAMTNLGVLYRNGQGMAQDYVAARSWFQKGADKGDPMAITGLGYLFHYGQGMAQDYAAARRWYENAADKGDPTAMTNLGVLYRNGQGMAQDYVAARSWFQKAADKGDSMAMSSLGVLYDTGRGVTQDYATARSWYEKAADKGDPTAMNNLGVLYDTGRGVTQDYATARSWYEKAADKGYPNAMYYLGNMYDYGRGVAQNWATARRWFEKAADKGYPKAMYELGEFYANGRGVTQDNVAARTWYEKAAAAGYSYAKERLAELDAKEPTSGNSTAKSRTKR